RRRGRQRWQRGGHRNLRGDGGLRRRAVHGFYSKRHLHREVLRDGRPYLVETRAQRDRRRLWQWRRGRCERQRGRDWILPPDSGPGRRHADQPVRPGHLRDQVLAQRRAPVVAGRGRVDRRGQRRRGGRRGKRGGDGAIRELARFRYRVDPPQGRQRYLPRKVHLRRHGGMGKDIWSNGGRLGRPRRGGRERQRNYHGCGGGIGGLRGRDAPQSRRLGHLRGQVLGGGYAPLVA